MIVAAMDRSSVAVPFPTVKVRVAFAAPAVNAKLPLMVAPVAPEPLTFKVTLPPKVSVPAPVVTLAPDEEPLSRMSAVMALVWLLPFKLKVPAARTVRAWEAKALAMPD